MTTSSDDVRISIEVTVIQNVGTDRSQQTHTHGRTLPAIDADDLRQALMESFLTSKRAVAYMAFDRPVSDQLANIAAKVVIRTTDSEKTFFSEREMLADTADEVASKLLDIFYTYSPTSLPGAGGDENEAGDGNKAGDGNEAGNGNKAANGNEAGDKNEASDENEAGEGNKAGDRNEAGDGNKAGDGNDGDGNEEDDDDISFEMLPLALSATMQCGVQGAHAASHRMGAERAERQPKMFQAIMGKEE